MIFLQALYRLGIPDGKVHLLPNGVLIPSQSIPVFKNTTVLYVGNFSQGTEHKGFDILIQAWALIVKENPAARLLIAGGGDFLQWQKMSASLNCDSSIFFLGFVSELDVLYQQVGVFILPSRGEGISNALLEAQSYGVPAVVSDIPGNRRVVEGGLNGYIAPVDDYRKFAEAVSRLLHEPALRKTLGDNARVRCRESFSIETVASQLEGIYEKCIHQYE